MNRSTKFIGTLAIAMLAVVGLTITGAAAVASQDVTIDDPSNDTVEVDVDFSSAVDGTVELINSSGSVVDSETISGSADATETFSVNASTAGDYSLNLTTTGSDSDVAINETRLIAERSVSVTDADNETVYVDLAFQGDSSATADIVLATDAGTTIDSRTVDYDGTSENATQTVEIDDSDGLLNDDYNLTATISSASAYESAYASVNDPSSGGLFAGGEILGQDMGVAVAGLLVIGGVFYYAREEDYL